MARKNLTPIDLTAVPQGTAPLSVTSTTTVSNLSVAKATEAVTVDTTSVSTNASFYPVFVAANDGSVQSLGTDAGLIYNPSSNQLSTGGDISINGGDLLTNQTTFNLINATATTLNIGGAATTMAIGASGSTVSFPGKISVTASSGDEGGEIFLNKAVTNTTITGGVTIDVYQDRLRFFEQGGSARGFYIDIPSGTGGAATNLALPFMYMLNADSGTTTVSPGASTTISAFGTNGLSLESGAAYDLEMVLYLTLNGTATTGTPATAIITPGSAASVATPSATYLYYDYSTSTTVLSNAAATSGVRRSGTTTFPALNTVTIGTGTTNYVRALMKGTTRITTGGNFTIRIALTGATSGNLTAVVNSGSYLKVTKLGAEAVTTIGSWG